MIPAPINGSGRVVFSGFPTGHGHVMGTGTRRAVAVERNSPHTSAGVTAIRRVCQPIQPQSAPAAPLGGDARRLRTDPRGASTSVLTRPAPRLTPRRPPCVAVLNCYTSAAKRPTSIGRSTGDMTSIAPAAITFLVTHADADLGLSAVQRILDDGSSKVVVIDSHIGALLRHLLGRGAGNVAAFAADLSRPEQVSALHLSRRAQFGAITHVLDGRDETVVVTLP